MIKLNGLNLKYRKLNNPTLKSINLEIAQGEKVLIVGPSGSGKSTLGKLLNGLIPNSQTATVSGDNTAYGFQLGTTSIFDLSTKIGTIMQDQDAQFVGLNVAEDIAFYLENLGEDVEVMHTKVAEVMNLLGISEIADTDPSRLSGGEKQKVSLAGVLVNDVNCLLLDEPLANLDPQSAVDVMNLISEINRDLNKTIIMIEHRLEDALIVDFDKIVLIDNGAVISCDTPSNLLKTDLLTNVGIRKPLYIEALANLNYDFKDVDNMLDYNCFDLSNIALPDSQQAAASKVYEPLLEAANINFSYGQHQVLKDVSFQIGSGEIVSLLGANGTGKSTLCDTIIGINQGYKGTIKLGGESIDQLGIFERSNLIGYVMQNPNHYITETTVEEEVGFTLKQKGMSKAEIDQKVLEALAACRLTKYKKWPINMLSYGQRRRVTIAACLVKNPKLIILDEPTAGQDFETFKSIMDTVIELRNKYQVSVLVITHNMQLAYEYSDRAIVLGHGKIQYDGSIEDLYENASILSDNNLRSTSIQRFSKVHNISSHALGQSLIGGERR